MTLSAGFTFSQASLQDYTDCPRRFQLRYVLGVRWPSADAVASEWETRAQQGAAFHRLVQQHTAGIPEATLRETIADPELRKWWQAYLDMPPPNLPTKVRRSEVRLSVPQEGYRLMARYDLLALTPGQRAVIVDWKTSKRRTKRDVLASRWQTRVYRYVLVEAGQELSGGIALAPEQIELVYWFTNFPHQSEHLPYDAELYAEDRAATLAAISEILAQDAGDSQEPWPLTDDLKHCRYCTYRTLCDKELVEAPEPDWEPQEEPQDWDVDLEQVGEIAF